MKILVALAAVALIVFFAWEILLALAVGVVLGSVFGLSFPAADDCCR